jgi:hypothetical protein
VSGGGGFHLDAAPSDSLGGRAPAGGATSRADSGGAGNVLQLPRAHEVGDGSGRGDRETAKSSNAGSLGKGIHHRDGGHDVHPLHDGQIRGRRAPLGAAAQETLVGDRRHLLEKLRGGQRHGPSQADIDVAAHLRKRRRTDGTAKAAGPEAGCDLHGLSTASSSQATRRRLTSCDNTGGSAGEITQSPAAHGHSNTVFGGCCSTRAMDIEPGERSIAFPGNVAEERSSIRGQKHLPGPRNAGNQYGDAAYERASNEDVKMHFSYVHAGRIRHTAYWSRGAARVANDTAADAAASLVAWHTAAAADPPTGGE